MGERGFGSAAYWRSKGWPAKLSEADGIRVRTARDMTNRLATIPAGTAGVVRVTIKTWDRLDFRGAPCACCGVAIVIGGLNRSDLIVEMIDGFPLRDQP